MGILNVTSDSFYECSRVPNMHEWLSQTEKMLSEGADIIDIGCVSTRPGATIADEKTEREKLMPVLYSIVNKFPEAIISVDTFRAGIAKEAVSAGASIINDISGGEFDDNMFQTISEIKAPYILMHVQGTSESMHIKYTYQNTSKEVLLSLVEKTKRLKQLGVNDIIIDPGIGFSKNVEQNYQILKKLHLFDFIPFPLLIGVSRKSLIWKTLKSSPAEALNGTTVLHTYCLLKKADIIRTHDVKEVRECIDILSSLKAQ
jgi:dihydropteroate synthase